MSQSKENYGFRISLEVGKKFQYCKVMESTKQSTKKENSLLDAWKNHHIQISCSDERSNHVEEIFLRPLGSPRSIQILNSP